MSYAYRLYLLPPQQETAAKNRVELVEVVYLYAADNSARVPSVCYARSTPMASKQGEALLLGQWDPAQSIRGL